MSEIHRNAGNYCSVCGEPLDLEQTTVADREFNAKAQQVYNNENGHVVVDGSQVRVLVHEDGGDS